MGSFLTGGYEHLLEGPTEAHGLYFQEHVRDYDSMIQSLYEICQKENESVKEYMLRVHEAVAVVKRAYPNQVPNEGEGLRRDCFYYGPTPSLRDVLSFAMADLPEREQADTSFDTPYHLAKKLEAHDTSCTM